MLPLCLEARRDAAAQPTDRSEKKTHTLSRNDNKNQLLYDFEVETVKKIYRTTTTIKANKTIFKKKSSLHFHSKIKLVVTSKTTHI